MFNRHKDQNIEILLRSSYRLVVQSSNQGLKSRTRWGYLARDLAFGKAAREVRVYLASLVKSREISCIISRVVYPQILFGLSLFLLTFPSFPHVFRRRRRETGALFLARLKTKSGKISPDLARGGRFSSGGGVKLLKSCRVPPDLAR